MFPTLVCPSPSLPPEFATAYCLASQRRRALTLECDRSRSPGTISGRRETLDLLGCKRLNWTLRTAPASRNLSFTEQKLRTGLSENHPHRSGTLTRGFIPGYKCLCVSSSLGHREQLTTQCIDSRRPADCSLRCVRMPFTGGSKPPEENLSLEVKMTRRRGVPFLILLISVLGGCSKESPAPSAQTPAAAPPTAPARGGPTPGSGACRFCGTEDRGHQYRGCRRRRDRVCAQGRSFEREGSLPESLG
jgi:hypothetical protein